MNTPLFNTPFGKFRLTRFPHQKSKEGKQDPLRAWDAADEYLLEHVATLTPAEQVLLLNDNFGALAVALHQSSPTSLGDSYVSHCATKQNLLDNHLEKNHRLISSLELTDQKFDQVLIKIPRALALLEDQLFRLRPHLKPDSIVIAAGMTKNIHRKTINLFEKILGPSHTSLAKKKSRLIFTQLEPAKWQGESPYPTMYTIDFGENEFVFSNHANVFAQDKLDAGTHLMLENLPVTSDPVQIVDLGSGNGILGVLVASCCPQAELHFIDESYAAIASSEMNFRRAYGETRKATYEINYQLEKQNYPVDLILNNPPFHHQNVNDDQVAWQMFNDSKRVLKKGGELRVVANRHLGYHSKLTKIFSNCTTVASNKKFVILSAIKS